MPTSRPTDGEVGREPPKRRGAAGFTLLEILAVLVIAGLSVGIVLPRLVPGLRGGIDAATTSLAEAMLRARSAAIAQARLVTFEVPATVLRFGIPVTGGPVTIYPDGSSDGAAIGVGEGARQRRVGIETMTGRVVVALP